MTDVKLLYCRKLVRNRRRQLSSEQWLWMETVKRNFVFFCSFSNECNGRHSKRSRLATLEKRACILQKNDYEKITGYTVRSTVDYWGGHHRICGSHLDRDNWRTPLKPSRQYVMLFYYTVEKKCMRTLLLFVDLGIRMPLKAMLIIT